MPPGRARRSWDGGDAITTATARALAAALLATAAFGAGVARAAPPDLVLSVGPGSAYPLEGEEAGGAGLGLYADVDYPVWRGRWFRPMAYAGALLVGSDEGSCDPGVAPCDVSARIGFVGAKARVRLPLRSFAPYLELGLGASAGRLGTHVGQASDASLSGVTYHVPFALGVEFGTRRTWTAKLAFLFHPEAKQADFGLAVGFGLGTRSVAGVEEAATAEAGAQADEEGFVTGEEGFATGVALAVPVEPPAAPLAEELPPGARGKVAFGAWLGFVGGSVQQADGWNDLTPVFLLPLPLSAGLGIGTPVGRSLLLGLEWNFVYGFNCQQSMYSVSGACNRTYAIQQLLALATWYPRWNGPPEQAPAGLHLRAGAGLALLDSRYTIIAEPDEPRPPPADTSDWRRSGGGVLAGAGYSVRVGKLRTRTFESGLDFAWQGYGGGVPPTNSFTLVARVGITFH